MSIVNILNHSADENVEKNKFVMKTRKHLKACPVCIQTLRLLSKCLLINENP